MEKRSERLKKVVGITTHIDEELGEIYTSVRVGEDLVKRIKSSRQNGYVLRKGRSVKEQASEWQQLPFPMTKIEAFKFAARDPQSNFINNHVWVDAFEEKIESIESRLYHEAHRKPRKIKVNSAEELLAMLQIDSTDTTEDNHVNVG